MADYERPNRSSNMEKAEGDRSDSPARNPAQDEEPLVDRHPRNQDPTRLDIERTSDNSTVDNGGVAGGRDENPVMPDDEATLRTEI
jgi:hypothetical protein